jgi:indole-3-glycerol phosphate synthase
LILDRIVESKKRILDKSKIECNINSLENIIGKLPEVLDFKNALRKQNTNDIRIIAEVKKASPSKGIIREDFDPLKIARQYEANNAAAISILTESEFFMGKLDFLREIKIAVNIPLLRKDFLFDPYQIYEARANGADAVLLIAAILEKSLLEELLFVVKKLSMNALVEVHTKEELKKVLQTDAEIIGINNRNLNTFDTNIQTSIDLMADIPESKVIVTESGIKTKEDIQKLSKAGVDAFLIGESFMRADNPGEMLNSFVN